MSSLLFIALPLLFGFATAILNRFGASSVAYASTIMQIFLLYLAFSLFGSSNIEIISIAPPLGISFVINHISILFVILFTFLITAFSLYYLSFRKTKPYKNETKFFILLNMLLASSIGLVLSNDIFNIYVFFEIAGISAYILSSYEKTPKALEAGLKYLITGAIAAIFLLFAIALIYLYIGSLNLSVIAENFAYLPTNIKLLISLLLLIGFGFKVEIFPFNFWVVDVYEGSSTLINSLFSAIVVKAYLFVFFHIIYLFNLELPLIYLGAISMLIAEIVALRQSNLKRMFAYSSLGQVALIFVAFSIGSANAVQSALFIVIAHSLAKLTIFLILAKIEKSHNSMDINTLKELNSPFLRAIMFISMLSLLGIPLFGGFVGKFLLFKELAVSGLLLVLFIIVLSSLLEAVYYFKISGFMLSKENKKPLIDVSMIQKLVLSILAFLIIFIGVAPFIFSGLLMESAHGMLDSVGYTQMIMEVK